MTIVKRIVREPVLITALVLALLAAGPEFGLDITDGQQQAIIGVIAAVLALLRWALVPAEDVVAVQKPWEDVARAGPAAPQSTGTEVVVTAIGVPADASRGLPLDPGRAGG